MSPNYEGFIYPVVNDECNNCGLCSKRCPQMRQKDGIPFQQISFIGITKDNAVYKHAASGGIFGTFAKAFLTKENSFVCGAAFVEGKVRHIIVSDVKKITLLQNSKYVQSDLGQVFPRIKELLQKDANVLFCGTPCQVDGLYEFLGTRHKNLVTLDLICHGVPSPLFLNKDLHKHTGGEFNKIQNVVFRWKHPLYKRTTGSYFLSIRKKSKQTLISSVADPYFACFMRNESFRLSCYTCKYASLERYGDITIGDCDSASFYPSFHPGMSRSTIIINNSHGRNFWDRFSQLLDYQLLDLKREAKYNHQLSAPSQKPECRNWIYEDVINCDITEIKQKYCKKYTPLHKMLFFCYRYLPETIVNKLIKFVR